MLALGSQEAELARAASSLEMRPRLGGAEAPGLRGPPSVPASLLSSSVRFTVFF